jgi:phage baseplate assembly protein W
MNEPTTRFLGTGWSFPPSFSVEAKGAAMVSGEEDIHQSLEIILSTGVGERLLRPDFGSDLRQLAFESLDSTQETLIRDVIRTALLRHEPRIIVEGVSVTPSPAQAGLILISVSYLITSTNSRSNLVFPFYLDEGSPA